MEHFTYFRVVYKWEEWIPLKKGGGQDALHELIKAIYVDAPDKSSGKRRQHIHIQYDGLGFIPLNELLAQKRRDQSHASDCRQTIFFHCLNIEI